MSKEELYATIYNFDEYVRSMKSIIDAYNGEPLTKGEQLAIDSLNATLEEWIYFYGIWDHEVSLRTT